MVYFWSCTLYIIKSCNAVPCRLRAGIKANCRHIEGFKADKDNDEMSDTENEGLE